MDAQYKVLSHRVPPCGIFDPLNPTPCRRNVPCYPSPHKQPCKGMILERWGQTKSFPTVSSIFFCIDDSNSKSCEAFATFFVFFVWTLIDEFRSNRWDVNKSKEWICKWRYLEFNPNLVIWLSSWLMWIWQIVSEIRKTWNLNLVGEINVVIEQIGPIDLLFVSDWPPRIIGDSLTLYQLSYTLATQTSNVGSSWTLRNHKPSFVSVETSWTLMCKKFVSIVCKFRHQRIVFYMSLIKSQRWACD